MRWRGAGFVLVVVRSCTEDLGLLPKAKTNRFHCFFARENESGLVEADMMRWRRCVLSRRAEGRSLGWIRRKAGAGRGNLSVEWEDEDLTERWQRVQFERGLSISAFVADRWNPRGASVTASAARPSHSRHQWAGICCRRRGTSLAPAPAARLPSQSLD